MSDLIINVRQVGNYPAAATASPSDLLLLQRGGLGGSYMSIAAQALVATALEQAGPLGVGVTPPTGAAAASIYTGDLVLPVAGELAFNATAAFTYQAAGFQWSVNTAPLMALSNAGALSLPAGTLTVARDPASGLEVATMGWVGRTTVASFNGRRGAVTLTVPDIYQALCLDSPIATQTWVEQAIKGGLINLLSTCPFVNRWNGRTGSVYLMLSDISCVFMQPGQKPITQTPPLTSNDYSIPNTAWVVEYITNELAGSGGLIATQQWVLANTVNSFNGRQGVVTLTSADVFDVGAAPLNSPQFSGIPTAPTAAVGTTTGQIATTAFVQAAISESTAGVASFNTRTGAVTLTNADIVNAGGLANPSPNLTGNPTAPTQAPGTTTPVIANCEFVMAALAAGAVSSFNTRTGAVTLLLSDVTGVGGAPIASPALTGTPTAPTASAGTNTTQIATTAFVTAAVTAAGGVSSFNSRTGAVTLEANDVSAVGGLINPSVQLTGTPTAPTATAGTNTTQIATTAFVQAAVTAGAVTSFNTRTGAVTLQASDITGAGGALLASPTFTGTPQAPNAAAGTNNTQIATTAFVTAAIAADTTGVTSFNTRTGAVTLTSADITGAGGALLASPSFTGIPTGPTATAGTSTTQLATTAFVQAAVGAGAVTSFNGRTGAVTLQANDISAVGGALLASPAFTGTPTVPTATAGTNTTQAASTAFVAAAVAPYIPQNYVDNSGFTVNQRGYVSGTALAAGAYGFDRWKAGAAGGTLTFSNPPMVTITAGSILQVLDGANFYGGSYTLSWSGTAQGRTGNGNGGLSNAYAASPITFTSSPGLWQTIEFTNGTLGQVQVQLGSIAAVWQPQVLATEWDRCQRFYIPMNTFWAGYGEPGTTGHAHTRTFITRMRVNPTVTWTSGPTYQNMSGATIDTITTADLRLLAYAVAAGPAAFYGSLVLDADF